MNISASATLLVAGRPVAAAGLPSLNGHPGHRIEPLAGLTAQIVATPCADQFKTSNSKRICDDPPGHPGPFLAKVNCRNRALAGSGDKSEKLIYMTA